MTEATTTPPLDQARAHLAAEAVMDLDATLATMEAPFYYEVWPLGLRMEGKANARTYYRHHFDAVRPRMRASSPVGEWHNADGLVIERHVEVAADDGSVDVVRVLAVLALGPTGVAGERIYAPEQFHRMNFGDLLETAFVPITG